MARQRKPEVGIAARTAADGTPSYRGRVWSARDGKQLSGPWFPTIAQARNWRQDALVGVRKGTVRAPVPVTVTEAAAAFLDGARAGTVLDRSGRRYKPSSVRNYDGWLRRYVLPRSATSG